jgi:hypothetical protein
MTAEQTAKGIGEQFRQDLAATWKPRLHDLMGWGKAFLLAVIPVIALDICVAMPFLPLVVVGGIGIPVILDRGQTLRKAS